MTTWVEGRQEFTFPPGWTVAKYDDSAWYRGTFGRLAFRTPLERAKGTPAVLSQPASQAAVDFIAVDVANQLFLMIEVKDYRTAVLLPSELADVLARKVRDTLASLALVATRPSADMFTFGQELAEARALRVYLDVQWPPNSPFSKLDRANVQTKVTQLFSKLGIVALVIDRPVPAGLWTVVDVP